MCDQRKVLTLSRGTSLSYRNQSNDLVYKSMDWFLYDRDLRHERVNSYFQLEPLLQVLTVSNLWHATSRVEPVENLNLDCAEWNFAVTIKQLYRANTVFQNFSWYLFQAIFLSSWEYENIFWKSKMCLYTRRCFLNFLCHFVYITFLHILVNSVMRNSIMTSSKPCSFLLLC